MAYSGEWPPRKGYEFLLVFPIFDNDGDIVTGAAGLDSEISKDGGAKTDCTNEASEIAASMGLYKLTLTATEMNADVVAVITKTSTGDAKTAVSIIYTSTTQLYGLAVTGATAANLATVDTVVDAIKAKTDNLPGTPAADGEYDTEMARITADVATEAKQDIIDGVVDAIKAKTDNLPSARVSF